MVFPALSKNDGGVASDRLDRSQYPDTHTLGKGSKIAGRLGRRLIHAAFFPSCVSVSIADELSYPLWQPHLPPLSVFSSLV